ncbi:MAG TPA: DUF2441 domain-containing protein [Bacillales bacterium]|nr:DUF2441 domain-containing protein [Bacillales bacterium]
MNYFHVSNEKMREGTLLNVNYGRAVQHPGWFRESDHNYAQYLKEMIFEDYRRAHFPEAPSRLNCIYLFDNLGTANIFKKNYNKSYLYAVEISQGARLSKVDMKWMDLANRMPIHELLKIAHAYFNGDFTNNKIWEIICDGEIRITKNI